jgi:GrpB-like predicted nucleotidyltransferase (UPF0157 family)
MGLSDPIYGLGLEQGVNRLANHNPLWSNAFAGEAHRLSAELGVLALAIEHFGSTAVPALKAKPIIDLQIGVADIAHGLSFIEPMARLGYDYAGDQGIPDHHIFGLGRARLCLAHVAIFESDAWFEALRFRDRLRSDPEARNAYEALKVALAAGHLTRAEYTAGKSAFVARTIGIG